MRINETLKITLKLNVFDLRSSGEYRVGGGSGGVEAGDEADEIYNDLLMVVEKEKQRHLLVDYSTPKNNRPVSPRSSTGNSKSRCYCKSANVHLFSSGSELNFQKRKLKMIYIFF